MTIILITSLESQVLSFWPFQRWGNWGTEVTGPTQLGSGGAEIWTQSLAPDRAVYIRQNAPRCGRPTVTHGPSSLLPLPLTTWTWAWHRKKTPQNTQEPSSEAVTAQHPNLWASAVHAISIMIVKQSTLCYSSQRYTNKWGQSEGIHPLTNGCYLKKKNYLLVLAWGKLKVTVWVSFRQ